ncbi:HAD family phosphatase [Lacibacter sp.]|uniref:HAD family hydrolase n=1 Tax=Lacibacter sp. TaxID=1915409 RepID=UPI002B4AF879|nr:HAD family phosphatase [Lacibacter sp.]HLP38112.1 HAD family phosphatase [Lacibacter sp.]
MNQQKAFLFDLNGTMIDDMHYHIKAWHGILNELGADISMERMKEECYGKNDELLERMFPGRFSDDEKREMSYEKERHYQLAFKPHLKLLPGLHVFLEEANQQEIKMAIGSAAIMFNIDFVLDNLDLRHYISAIVSADDVAVSKPDPETFVKCAERLSVEPTNCIVFEDAPKGVESAKRAGMKAVVLTTLHEEYEFDKFDHVLMCVKDFTDERLRSLFN